MTGSRIFSINLGGGSGSGIEIYATPGDLPAGQPDGTVAFVLSTRKLYAYDADTLTWDVIGGFGAILGRAQSDAISASASSHAVTFSTPMASTGYSIQANITNLVDADPIFLQVVSITKTVNGFTANFNAATDSANYILEYTVGEHI